MKVDEDEVERAAAKVYERLEQRGVSFGVSESIDPSIESVAKLFKSKIAKEEEDKMVEQEDEQETHDEEHEEEEEEQQHQKEEKEEEDQPPVDNAESISQIDGSIAQDNEEESESDDDASDEAISLPKQPEEEAKVPTTAPPSAKRQHIQRNVPFRGMRKAFAAATGLHGIITPSTVQLRQRHARARRRQQQRPEGKPTQDKSKDDKSSSEDEGANELILIRTESTSSSGDEIRDTDLGSDSPPANTELNNDQWSNGQEQNVVYESSNDAAIVSWGRQSSGGYGDTAHGGVHWPQEQNLEPPPLPDFEQ
mmetsp:Transcript_18436/g.23565  ORF Transcript_18436/g.23565 Transcript_18436/m.23565 type:complete len:309 (+) Transcript_18436:1-927(+)